MVSWTSIARFDATDGRAYFSRVDGPQLGTEQLTGYVSFDALQEERDGSTVTFQSNTEIVCIGTNYRKHAEEAGLTVPSDPVMWYKPQRSLAGPGEIPVPKSIQDGFIDFEGELVIVISKDCRDVSEEDAPNFILGYAVGNDLTARMYQDPRRAGGQFSRAKAFDNFAPIGPVLVSAEDFGSLEGKTVRTTVNGRELQNSALDLIHSPAKLVSFLSQGTTIAAGTPIMTGTPPGIGWFQDPKASLKDGDVVEVEVTGLGKLSNTIRFE